MKVEILKKKLIEKLRTHFHVFHLPILPFFHLSFFLLTFAPHNFLNYESI
jgi:hypothetical protein